MASGFRVGSTDLDDVFDPYVQGTKPAVTGFRVAAQDLRDRYAPIAFGTAAAATGFRVSGADLNTLFAKKGTASYLSASITPSPFQEELANGAGNTLFQSTCNVTGGSGAITYLWERISGDARISATHPNSASTAWSSSGNNEIVSATFRCTVTRGGFQASATTVVSISHGQPQ